MNEQTVSVPGTIHEVVGTPIVVRPGEAAVGATKGFELKPNDLLFTPAGSELVVAINNELFLVDENCVGCINIAANQQPQLSIANLNGELVTIDEPTDAVLDVNAIQEAILAGEDPTEILESTEAGGTPDGSAISTSSTIPLNLAQTIAATKFETAGFDNQREQFEYEDGNDVVAAEGGLIINTTVTEGNLSDGTYPQQTLTQATVTAGTLSLDPSSFVPVTSSLSALLNELNSEITSSGQPVDFIYDPTTNAIIGSQGEEKVLTIDIDALQSGKDILLRLTTTLEKPIDHDVENGSQGLVQFSDNLLQVSLTLTGADTNGNPLKQPLSITVSVEDGDEQSAVEVDESYTEAVTLSEDNPYQTSGTVFELGADELEVVRFDANAIDQFVGVLSDNQETEATLTEDGKTLTLTIKDAPEAVILAIVLSEDGTYSITQNLPLEQNNDQDALNFAIPVTSIDYDGDVVTNVINYQVIDGAAPTVELPNSIEPVLESQLDSGSPVLSQGMLGYQGSDAVQHFEIDVEAFNSQYQGLLQSGELDITLVDTTQDDGSFIHSYAGKDEDGGTVFTITLQPDGSYTFELLKPLDHSGPNDPSSADNNLYHLDFPIYAVDSDDDKSDSDSALDGAQATTLTIAVVDDVSTLKESILFDQVVEPTIGVDGIVTATQNIFSDVSQDGDQVTHFVYGNQNYNLDDYTPNAQGVYAVALNPVGDDDTGIGTVYITRDGDISFQPNSDILHTDDTSINDILTANLEVFTKDGDDDVDSVDVTLKIKDGDNISFVGELELSFTETQNPQTFTLDNDGHPLDIGVQVGSDNIVSLDFVSDENSGSVLNSITVDEAPTYVHIIDDGQSIVVSLASDPNDQTGYVLQATLSEDAQGVRSGEYTVIQHQAFDQVDDVLTIEFPFAAEDSDGDITRDTIDVTVNDGADITVCNPDCFVKLRETKRLDGSEENAITRYASVELKQGSDEIDTVVWQVSPEMEAALAALTTQGQDTQYQITDGLIRVFIQDEHGNQQDVITFELQGDKSGDYTVTQYLPIDNDMSDNKDSFEFSIVATDADGDSVVADIEVILKDGANTKLSDSALSYTEKEHKFGDAKNGSVKLKAGSDGVSEISVALDNLADVEQWTSQGQALSVIQDGNDFTLVYESDPSTAVLEFIFNNNTGAYQVIQHLPIDQDGSNQSELNFTVTASSTDDADTQASIDITIKDGVETSLKNRTVTLKEQDDSDNQFIKGEVSGDVNLKPGVDGVSALVLGLSAAQVNDIEANWSSQGNELSVVVDYANNIYTLVYKDDPDNHVLQVSLDGEGNYHVEQLLPIDQEGATSTLTFSITASSTDDADISKTLTVNIKDGVDTSLKNDEVTLHEMVDNQGDFAPATVHGDVQLNPGPDGAETSIELVNLDQVENWTSNGQPTTVTTTDSSITLWNSDDEKVLELIYYPEEVGNNAAGTYQVTQYAAIDQLTNNVNKLLVDVTATSTDDDSLTKQITVKIKDGVTPSIEVNGDAELTETTDMSDVTPAMQTFAGLLGIESGTDALTTVFFQLANDSAFKLNDLTSENRPLEVKSDDGSYSLFIKGSDEAVLNISLDKQSGDVTVKQYLPLDNPADDNIVLTIKATASDTDLDTGSNSFKLTLVDGQDPAIDPITSLDAYEKGIDEQNDNSEFASTKLTFADSSDNIETIEFQEQGIVVTDQNDAAVVLKSDGQVVQFEQSDNGLIGFIGSGNSKQTVLEVTVNSDYGSDDFGLVEFTLHQPVEHPGTGIDSLKLTLPVVATDFDGDPSPTAYLAVNLIDDVSTLKPTLVFDQIVEPNVGSQGLETGVQNIFADVSKDGDQVTNIKYADVSYNLDDYTPNGDGVYAIELDPVGSDDSGIGTVYITRDGDISFKPNSDILHTDATATNDILTAKLEVFTQDGDGDPDSIDVTLKIKDGDNISVMGDLTLSFTETQNAQTFTKDGNGQPLDVGLQVGSDNIASLSFVSDSNPNSVLNSITVDEAATFVHVIDNGQSIVVSLSKNPSDAASYVLQATFSEDAQGERTGAYKVIQHQAFDQTSDVLTLSLPFEAKDSDGDITAETIDITVHDGADISVGKPNSTLSLTETLLLDGSQDNAIVKHSTVKFIQGSDEIDTVAWQLSTEAKAAFEVIKTQGQDTDYQVDDGVIRVWFTDGNGVKHDVMTLVLDDDNSGGYTVTQYLPIDNDISDNNDLFELSIVATDADGDPTVADIEVRFNDGVETKLSTSAITYTEKEGQFGNAKNGSVQLKAGSDGVSEVSVTLDNEAEVMDWTSQDQALDIVKSGNDYTLVYESDPDNKVLEFIFDSTTGNYQVIQHKPIDQDVSNLSKLEFTVTATSTDDANVQASIDVTIKDGVETRLSNSTIQYTEKQTGIDPDVSYGFKTGSVNIKAGVDGVSEVEVSIDDSDALSSWTSQGKPLELLENGNDFKLVYADDLNQTVIEFNFDDETGDYSVEQFLPIDQIGAEQSVINLTVGAFSTDDEKSTATIAITIKDGAETSLKNRTVTLTEKDDGDNQFIKGEVSGDVNLKPGVDGVSAVALTLSQAQINDINANWTSQGKALAVVEDLDSNTYSVVYKNDPTAQVLKVVLDDEGNYKVEQSLPIDQQGSTSSLVFDVTVSSTDDANISKTLTVNIKDGVDTSLKNDQVTLKESVDGDGEFATKSVSGDVKLNPGPDGAESSISLNNQDDVSKWTSNGNPLKLVATDDTITLLDEDNNKVLELIYYPEAVGNKVAGSYDVVQYAAIDQSNNNVSTMLVDVTATSTDDNPLTKQITVNIKDGVTPSIDINGSASLTETTDMDVATPAKKTFTQLLDIHSGTDDIDTVLFALADNSPLKLDDLTSEGRELEVKSEDGSYSLFIKGSTTEVLNITLDKQSGDVTVEQYRPLDNPLDNHIELKIVATAKDTDGDSGSNSFNLTLVDGQDPQIKPDSSVDVYEKGLGESDDHTESNSVSVEFEASSDNIKTIEIKPTGIIITDQNDAPVTLTADKQAVQFEQTSNGLIGFIGSGDSKETVFEATVNSDYTSNDFGKVTFTLLKEVDHPNAGTDALVLKLPIMATDFDGDTSQTGAQQAYVTVNLIDDVSTLNASILFDDINEPTLGTQGSTTEVKNIFADVSKDGDQVTHIVYDNKSYDLDDYTPDGQGVYAIALDAKGADDNGIGTVYITRDGDISFKPNSDILHTDATSAMDVLTAKLEVHTKDGDNDVDSVDVTLKIKDGTDIGFAGKLDVAWTEVSAIKTITTDSEGETLNVSLTSGSDHLASLKFVADSDTNSVLNNITVDEAETFVHIINGGDSIVVSTNQNQPLNVADYILQATLSKDTQGNANGEYSITQYKPFDQAQSPIDAAVILLPLVATDTDGDPTPAEIKLTVTDGQDITVGNSTSSVQLNETLTLDGTEENAISQHDSVSFVAGVDGIDSVKWQDDAALRTLLDGITTQGKETKYSVSDDTLRVYLEDGAQGQDVITFVLDSGIGGGYTVKQYLPIDNANDDTTNIDILNLAIVATDKDGDDTVAPIKVNLKDGVNTTMSDASEEWTETDTIADEFVVVTENGNVNLALGSDGVETLKVNLTTADINAIETNWTSQGKALAVDFDSGTNTYTLVYKDNPATVVLEFKLDSNGSYEVKQSLPLDQAGEKSTIVFNIIASSTDDADVTAKVTLNIKDGVDTTIQDSTEALTETLDGDGNFTSSTVSGDTQLDPGPDGHQTTISLKNYDEVHGTAANQFKGWSSNGNDIEVTETDTTVTLTDKVTGEKVLELTYYPEDVGVFGDANFKAAGTYDVTQFRAIDQPEDNISQLQVTVTSRSTDDTPKTAQITINITDGTTPTIIANNDASLTETVDMAANTPANDSFTQMLDIDSGTDAVDTVIFDLADSSVYQLADLTSSGQELVVQSQDSSYSLFIKGTTTEVLNIAVNKANGDVTVEQYQPLDNPLSNDIVLTLNATVTDTDGDSASDSFDLTLTDGMDPRIEGIGSIKVNEYGIGHGNRGEFGSATITLEPSSDNIEKFEIDTTAISVADKDGNPVSPLTSGNKLVQYEEISGGYRGFIENGNKKLTVFEVKINSDYTSDDLGKVDFKLVRGIDHPDAGTDSLFLTLPVIASDFDGDSSPAQGLNVEIKDYFSDAKNVTINLVEGSSTSNNGYTVVNYKQGDRLDNLEIEVPVDQQGKFAFGDIDNPSSKFDLDTLGTGNGIAVLAKNSNDQWAEVGTITLITKGSNVRVKFSAADSVDHLDGPLSTTFTMTAIDNDGDQDSSNLNLTIRDKESKLVIDPVRGDEDTDIAVTIEIDLHDADGEEIQSLLLGNPAGGSFYYIDPNGGAKIEVSGRLSKDKLDVSGTDVLSINNIFYQPDDHYSTDANGFEVNAQVKVEREGHPVETRNGRIGIVVDGIADKPEFSDSSIAEASGDEDSLIKLDFAFETDDQSDASAETITYELTFNDANAVAEHQLVKANGSVITPDNDGVYHFTSAEIGNVYLAAKGDFSGSVLVDVKATSHEPFTDSTNSSETTLTVDVAPIVDDITYQVERVRVNEDTEFKLKDHIQVNDLKDSDGSENRFVYIKDLPNGTIITHFNADGDNAVILNGEAYLIVDPDDYATATLIVLDDPADKSIDADVDLIVDYALIQSGTTGIIPPKDSNADFDFKVEVKVVDTATYADGEVVYDSQSMGNDQTIAVDIKGIADAPMMDADNNDVWQVVTDNQGAISGIKTTTPIDENSSIMLDFSVFSGETGYDKSGPDGSETVTVVLYAESGNLAEYKIEDTDGNEISLTYTGMKNGQAQYEADIGQADIKITPKTNNTEDIQLKAKIIVTENDGNELVTEKDIFIEVNPVISGFNDNFIVNSNDNNYTPLEDQVNNVKWYPGKLTDRESGGDHEFVSKLVISGNEAESNAELSDIALTIEANSAIAQVLIDGVATGLDAGKYRFDATNEVTIIAADGAELTAGNVEISALVTPEDSSADFVLDSTVSVTEVDVDSNSGFSKTVDYSGKLNIDIQPVVEDDGELNIIDGDDVGIEATQTNTAGSVSFTINKEAKGGSFANDSNNSDYSINFIDLDADSTGAPNPENNQDERVSHVVIEFAGASQNVLDQLYVQGALNNGDGTWTVTNEDSFIVFAPNGVNETVTVKVHALVIDRGEDGEDSINESEVSYAVRDTQSFQITFDDPEPSGTVSGEAASASIDNTQAIEGTEDTKVRLDDTLREKLIFSELANLDDSSTNDQITIVFDVSNIHEIKRVTSGTGEENFVNGKYAFTIDAEDVNDDGSLKEGALGNAAITLIEDFAGDFTIPISVVITDMDSGDENVVTQQVNFEITPVVDGVTKDNGVVVQTVEAADFTAGEESPSSIQANTAYEDSQVTLNLNRFSFKDEDTDLSQGVESFAAIEISSTVGAVTAGTVYSGVEEKEDGTLSITAAQLPNGVTVEQVLAEVVFTPSKDFSGKVTITLDGTIIDQTDNVGSVTAPFKQTFDIDVKSIVDGVTTQSLGDKVIDGSEDTPMSLSVLDFTLDDSDGSEEFVSFKLTDVPQDFLVSSTSGDFAVSNNGSGVWSIKIAQPVGETVDLSDIQITPAENFSGSANIGYVVYTQEEADKQPKQQGGRITLNIAPEGDEIDTRIDQHATGAEHSGADSGLVDIKIDARILDKADSISAGAHSENSPETVYIKVENIPDGVSILLPEYTKGADLASGDYIAYQELDNGVYTGNWIVETNLQQVENIQLDLTGTDYNSDSWRGDNPQITLKVSSNDNGSLGPVAEQIVSLEITPDNDKPAVVAQTSYSVDEDVQLSISSIQISDADVIDDPDANMTVTISHTTGNLSFGTESIQYANDNNITIGSDSDGNIVLDGTIESINKLLSGSEVTTDKGLLFIGDENSHVDSQIQVQVTDNGNNGDVNGDGTIDINDALTSDQITVDVKVNPISDKPTLEAERNRYLVAVNDAQLAVIPLLGLIPALAVADESLSVQFDNVPAGTTIKVGGVTATLNGDGLFQADVPQGGDTDITIEVPAGITVSDTAIEIRAVSTDGDADPALSDPVTINVTADSSQSILGTVGNDYLFNLDDSDGITLSGGAGDDIIIGSDGADILEGGAGDDQILAGDGDDIVQGGLGSDILTGGGGQDIFVWTAADIDLTNPQVDKITDFNADKSLGAEKDMIDLSEVFESDDSMEDILSRLTAEKDGDKINIEILAQEGGETVQTIVLENQAGYTLDGGSASLMDDLINNEFIKLTNPD
ncbi:hypothetical protein BIY21_10000 [Vibrio ponticus]|uniref:DUF5801 domain-containing protein n=1 Tax=Vibrio ponticus TaxID=265668 RepID=A0ABX3FNF5_9VIBR|nr:retention module-containing protein [Vibrio ponticus]OLQ93978.1 hypothetical protein BIY21_10000 [Vibrio ponticus]